MSIRSVSCPGCSATLNVPATMSNIKCSACGTIWNVANPSAAKKTSAARERDSKDSEEVSDSDAGVSPGMMISIAGGVLALLVLLGIGVAIMTGSTNQKPAATEQPAATAQPTEKVKLVYRTVKLPESQRKKIYYDYRQVAASSVEKNRLLAKKICNWPWLAKHDGSDRQTRTHSTRTDSQNL